MDSDDSALLKSLLTEVRLLSLGVLIDGAPYVGLLPFALTATCDALLIHASALAKHAKGLRHGSQYSALIHAADSPDRDPLQIPRVSLQGLVNLCPKDSHMYHAGKQAYLARFPTSEQTFSLGDFHLYALQIDSARFVAGFGKTFNVEPDRLHQIISH